jgi:hypothetical protein
MSRQYGSLDDYGILRGINNYVDVLIEFCKEGRSESDSDVCNILEELSKFLLFRTNMIILRKQWTPQCGKGSQEGIDDMHIEFLSKCLDWTKQCVLEYRQEYGNSLDDDNSSQQQGD